MTCAAPARSPGGGFACAGVSACAPSPGRWAPFFPQRQNVTNPYRPPLVQNASAEPARRHFQWRIVTVVALLIYGVLAALYGAVALLCYVPGATGLVVPNAGDAQWHRISDAQICVGTFALAVMGIHGCLAIAAGRYLWIRCWRRCAIALASAVVLLAIFCMAIYIFPRLPPGCPLLPRHAKSVETLPGGK